MCVDRRRVNKEALAIKAKQWREDNKETLAIKKKQYSQDNKEAIAIKSKQYREDNKEAIKIYRKQYRQDNKEALAIRDKQYYEDNKEAIITRVKQYYEDNKEAIKIYKKQHTKQYRQDKRHHCEHNTAKHTCKICHPLGHLKNKASSHILKALKSYNGKNNRTASYLCCTIEEYREYLEARFTPEMTWDNMGTLWQIDHIIPILYKMNGEEPDEDDIIERLKYTNTQPMKTEHNISKGNRYIGAYRPNF